MRHVPWHVKGVRPDAREVARDAARRSGLSVGEWLNSLIIDAAAHQEPGAGDDPETLPSSYPAYPQPSGDADPRFGAIRKDIDALKWQIDRLSQSHGARPLPSPDPPDRSGNARLAESIARLERQLEALNRNGASPSGYQTGGDRHPGVQDSGVRNTGVDDAFAEITARQQFLDADAPDTQPYDAPSFGYDMPRPQPGPSVIEQQMRDIGTRIRALQGASRCDTVAAEIARTMEHAAPKRAIESIDEQLRRLSARLESMRPSAQIDQAVEALRRDVADIARRINDATPQPAVAAIEEQIRALSGQVTRLQQPRAQDIAQNITETLRKDFAEFRASFDSVAPPQNVASIEEQVRLLSSEIAKLQQPRANDVVDALRRDLEEISATVRNAFPPHAVASIEEQVQALNAQMSKLSAPAASLDDMAKVLRQDLVEIGAVLHDAMPTSAIAALEQEVRALGQRLEENRSYGAANLGGESPATAEFEQALAEIRERLRALTPAEDLAELSHAVKSLTRKADAIVSESPAPELLQQLEQAIGALHGLASQVASQDAVAGLSRDIHSLADKIDRSSRPAGDPDIMVSLERRLAEMADAVGRSRSESPVLPDFDSIIKTLADRLEATQIPVADQGALKDLERRMVTLVDKLEQSEVRLSRQELDRQNTDRQNPDRADPAVERGMTELLTQLKELRVQNENKLQAIQQQLVASTAEAISAPAEAIRRDVATLKEIQTSADRRTQDTFEAVYGTIEQVVDRLATIEEGLRGKPAADHASPRPVPAEAAAIAPTAPPVMIADAPALAPAAAPVVEAPVRGESYVKSPAASASAPAKSAPAKPAPAAARQPIISDLPPDSPLEPGSGARRVRVVANAIDRIAASEAVNGAAGAAVKTAEAVPPARANFVAAARRAAQAVASEQGDAPAARTEKAIHDPKQKAPPSTLMQRLGPRIKSVVLGISVILLVLGALRLALDFFYNPEASAPPLSRTDDAAQPQASPPQTPEPPRPGKGAGLQTPILSGRSASLLAADTMLGHAPTSGVLPEPPPPAPRAAASRSPMSAALPDTTGALPVRNPLLQGPAQGPAQAPIPMPIQSPSQIQAPSPAPAIHDAALPPAAPQTPPPRDLSREALPVTIGSKALVAAASAGDPGASYEVATRYAEGRNVPQDLALAAAWFDRAARSGLAPAQFRLGSMYEKGLGIKKDLQEARRLYLAATDKGNAKAMHNLAVLYAEGLEGKPDYAAAAQWFGKAAAHGVVDSQYNLAILFARGVGIERNMAESYKWFALAAKGGDKDAGKKRDEIATRLEPQQLESAKRAFESFAPDPQPEEATSTRAPPGGWDQVVAAAPTKSKGAR